MLLLYSFTYQNYKEKVTCLILLASLASHPFRQGRQSSSPAIPPQGWPQDRCLLQASLEYSWQSDWVHTPCSTGIAAQLEPPQYLWKKTYFRYKSYYIV